MQFERKINPHHDTFPIEPTVNRSSVLNQDVVPGRPQTRIDRSPPKKPCCQHLKF